MMTVNDSCKYIRSKNAGPFWITMDIFCDTEEQYLQIKNSDNFTREIIGKVYEVNPDMVKVFFVDSLNVVKVSIPRKVPQGDKYERDMHGGQQYLELSRIVL